MQNILYGHFDLRTIMICEVCDKGGRPLLRVWGMPAPEGEENATDGRVRLMGCCMPPESEPVASYECRHCGADVYVYRHL